MIPLSPSSFCIESVLLERRGRISSYRHVARTCPFADQFHEVEGGFLQRDPIRLLIKRDSRHDSKIDSRLRSVRHVSAAGFEILHGPIAGSDRLLFQIQLEFYLIPKLECSLSSHRIWRVRNRSDSQTRLKFESDHSLQREQLIF